MTALSKHQSSSLTHAKTWVSLSDSDLRRRAMTAANERDLSELWSLTRAYVFAHGKKGGKTSEGTLSVYQRGLKELLEHWQGENLIRPSRDAGVMYIRSLEQFLQPQTVKTRLASARLFYKALRWASATEATPFENVKVTGDLTPDWEKRKPYKQFEIEALLSKADLVDQSIILFGAHAGLRLNEMTEAKWSDLSAQSLKVIGKGSKARTVPVSNRLLAVLNRHKAEGDGRKRRRSSAYILPFGKRQVEFRFQYVAVLAGVDYTLRTIHGLRHTAGTRMYAQTKDLGRVSRFLGHADPKTSMIYAKLAEEELLTEVKDW